MKKLFVQYVVSNSLNKKRPLPKFWRKLVSSSRDLEELEASARRLDHRLRQPPRSQPEQPPPTLHPAIMRAVSRVEKAESRPGPAPSWRISPFLRGASAVVLALVLGAAFWLWQDRHLHRPGQESSPLLAQNDPALPARLPALWTLLDEISTNGPALLAGPWSRQVGALSNDMREAAQFILASLP